MKRLLRALLAAVVGLTVVLLPSGVARADDFDPPVYDNPLITLDMILKMYGAPSLGFGDPQVTNAHDGNSDGTVTFHFNSSYNNAPATTSQQDLAPFCNNYSFQDFNSAGQLIRSGTSPDSIVIGKKGTMVLTCTGVAPGNYTYKPTWGVGGPLYFTSPTTFTVPSVNSTKYAVSAAAGDDGRGNGSVTFSVCADNSIAESLATVTVDGAAAQNAANFTGCTSMTFDNLAAGWHTARLAAANEPAGFSGSMSFVVASTSASPSPTPTPTPSPTAAAVSVVSSPTIAGKAAVGSRVTATGASFSPATTTVRYQWLRDGAPIPGATSASRVLTAADFGKRISVQATGSLPGGASATATSKAVKVGVGPSLAKVKAPAVRGTAKVGKKLTATPGTWKPKAQKVTYQWLRGGKPIKGATKVTYSVVKADKGKKLSVKVTAQATGYAKGSATSKSTAAVKG